MLAALGLEFSILPPREAESVPAASDAPVAYASSMALLKAASVSGWAREVDAVVGADTVVYASGRILGKPRDAAGALEMLRLLNGGTHEVISAAVITRPGHSPLTIAERTRVSFALWPEAVLRAYVETGESADKAGSYAAQGIGSFLVRSLDGSLDNVIGLPLDRLVAALLQEKIIAVSCPESGYV